MPPASPALPALLDAVTEVSIVAANTEGFITLFNRGAEKMLGYTAAETIGQLTPLAFHDWGEVNAYAQQLAAKYDTAVDPAAAMTYEVRRGRPSVREWTYVRKDGRRLLVSLALSAIYDATGQLTGFLGVASDITARKSAEAKLIAGEHHLRQAQEIARTGSWHYDYPTGQFHCSEQLFQLYEITDEAERARVRADVRHVHRYLHPDDAATVRQQLREVNATHADFRIEHRIVIGSARTLYVVSIGRFLFDAAGRAQRLLGTVQDVTPLKERELELIEARQQAERANGLKQQFLSTMSHEIRTPMNAVVGAIHLLLQNDPRPDQHDSLKLLRFASENLLQLLDNILEFSRFEAGKASFEATDFNLRELLTSLQQSFAHTLPSDRVRLRTRLDAQLPDCVVGDPLRLAQVLNNLLSNAIKFTPTGSITLEAQVAAQDATGTTVAFAVTDTGIGVAADRLPNIFESFVQATPETARRYGGTGLGLAITKRLLELQGSQISVESTEGVGSRFSFALTFARGARRAEPAAVVAVHSLAHVRVLLVEDNEMNRHVASQFLRKWGIDPEVAANGRVALDKVRDNAYDLVLMDLQMPEMDGYAATAAIRALPGEHHQQLPIVALTAASLHEVQALALPQGITDFLSKPFNPDALLNMVLRYAPPADAPSRRRHLPI